MNLWVAFFTGLTAGGLGCLTVQGGLLATVLAHQAEMGVQVASRCHAPGIRGMPSFRIAQPILLFLLAKLIAYSALGFLLGACGAIFQITPLARAVLLIVIGLFLLGNGLRLLNVHPIFRGLVVEPPAAITGLIHRTSKNGTLLFTPLFLGCLTVFLPCGVTQAMMAAAMGTGQPVQGAALMAAFILGTTPLFFVVAYFATRIGATLERYFRRLVALILISMGAVSCLFGLNLAGVPLTLPESIGKLTVASGLAAAPAAQTDSYVVNVSKEGYSPAVLHLPAHRPVTLIWLTKGDVCCAQSVVIPGLNYQVVLPVTGQTPLAIPAQEKNAVLNYSCSMGCRLGKLVFDGN